MPKYNSHHYDDLAAFLKAEPTHRDYGYMMEVKALVAERLANRLAADNPQFDRERFLEACGLD